MHPGVDLGRVLAMLMIHDLLEVEAGDVPTYDEQERVDVEAAQQRAVRGYDGQDKRLRQLRPRHPNAGWR